MNVVNLGSPFSCSNIRKLHYLWKENLDLGLSAILRIFPSMTMLSTRRAALYLAIPNHLLPVGLNGVYGLS